MDLLSLMLLLLVARLISWIRFKAEAKMKSEFEETQRRIDRIKEHYTHHDDEYIEACRELDETMPGSIPITPVAECTRNKFIPKLVDTTSERMQASLLPRTPVESARALFAPRPAVMVLVRYRILESGPKCTWCTPCPPILAYVPSLESGIIAKHRSCATLSSLVGAFTI